MKASFRLVKDTSTHVDVYCLTNLQHQRQEEVVHNLPVSDNAEVSALPPDAPISSPLPGEKPGAYIEGDVS